MVCAVAAGVAAVAAVDAARLDIGAATAEKEKAAAEKDAAEKAAAEATESVAGSKSVSASAISTADLGRRSNIYFTGKSTRAASGSKWRNTGATKPIEGRELSNSNLASALKITTDFSKENWDAFGLEDLRSTDWIKSGAFHERDDGIAKSANNDSPRPASCIGGCLNPAEGFHHKLCPNWTRKTWKPPPIKKLTKCVCVCLCVCVCVGVCVRYIFVCICVRAQSVYMCTPRY